MTTQINGTGNLTIEDSRIKGDFSTATIANRVMFQTSTENSVTVVSAIPSGTGTQANFNLHNNSDPTNASDLRLLVNASEARIQTSITGSGAYLPMTFYTVGLERMRIDTSGNVLATNSSGLGYGTGSGGTVTQATSKSTAVTLNKPTGQITMNNAALAAGALVTFRLDNSLITTKDMLLLTFSGSTASLGAYNVWCDRCDTGLAWVCLRNISGGSLSEAVTLNFAIIKGAAA